MNTAIAPARSATDFAVGQRWISNMEPELGLGSICGVERRRITIAFHDGATVRIYTKEDPPLRRMKFKPGDSIVVNENDRVLVESTEERDFLVYYRTAKGTFCETHLSGSAALTAPMDRLMTSRVDTNDDFVLRTDILALRFRITNSPVSGYVGGRIELIPHQLYIANEVSSRYVRRVMLADEVGLGKTVEACLLLHRLLVSKRISRVMIVVPQSMVHVWFVELVRKFNLVFTIVETDDAGGDGDSGENPFSRSSLLLLGINHGTGSTTMIRKACEIDWDVVIVDEAHHILEGTGEFEAMEALSRKTKDLFLLTATPQHCGERNHFARLRLLDPSRYASFEAHCTEAEEHKKIAEITGKILDGADLDDADLLLLRTLTAAQSALSFLTAPRTRDPSETDRTQAVAELIDRQGIGRALFRNTRANIGGFPLRKVTVTVLESSKHQRENALAMLREDLHPALPAGKRTLTGDPRVGYLANLLKGGNGAKLLVICRDKRTVVSLHEALQRKISVKTALFHEDLTLLQRDRNAAWFSDEEGARVLICSEIGSEGRNFQFAHRLCLFDLPVYPELVEQRIGRLDRIGQKNTIDLHIPVLSATPEAFLSRWYHEGVGIFNAPVPAAQEAYERFYGDIHDILHSPDFSDDDVCRKIDRLIDATKNAVAEISVRLKSGRDRLLEQHSFRPKEAQQLISMIRELDGDRSLRTIMKRLFKSRGILVEEFHDDTWNLLSESRLDECFPGLNPSRSIVTFNREKALRREDYEFLTIDHPAVTDGIDLFLDAGTGNACFAIQKEGSAAEVLLEAVFTAECVAPPSLFVNRFLPPVVITVIVDSALADRSGTIGRRFFDTLETVPSLPILEKSGIQPLLPSMMARAEKVAEKKCSATVQVSLSGIRSGVGAEIERLTFLKKKNPSVSEAEIAAAEQELCRLTDAVTKTAPRLEAVRLIWCPGRAIKLP